MKIKDILSKEKYGNVKETSDFNNRLLKQILDEIAHLDALNPKQFYYDWFKGKDSIMEKLSHSLASDYYLELQGGNRTNSFFLSSLLTFKITDYIKKQYNFSIDFKQGKLLSYDHGIYYQLSFVTVSLLINKYNPATLYREHIIFICLKVAMTYFSLYQDNRFLVNLNDVHDVTLRIMNTDIEQFYDFACTNGFKSTEHNYTKREKTLTEEQVKALIQPNDTQTEIIKKIMRWCPCKERKARKIMSQYGLTNASYIRKSYRQQDVQTES